MQIRKTDKHMSISLREIAKKAKKDPRHKFGNLYSLLNEENLKWCFPRINKKAAPGVDSLDYKEFKSKLDDHIKKIVKELKGKNYGAKLVRRHDIPSIGGLNHEENRTY